MKTLQRGLFKQFGDTVNTLSIPIGVQYAVCNNFRFISIFAKHNSPGKQKVIWKCSLIISYYISIPNSWLICLSEPVIPHFHLKEIGERYGRELAAPANQPNTRKKSSFPYQRLEHNKETVV